MSSAPSIKTPPGRVTPVPPPSSPPRGTCVYGDSTPFLHEGNFIETIRHAVDCGVALLSAQHVIHKSIARAQDIDRAREVERARLESLGNTLKRAMAGEMATSSDRLLRTGARILETSRVTIETELVSLESAASAELTRARRTAEQARAAAKRALETFLVLHDLPGSEIALWLKATEESYAAESQVQTPFGVDSNFELQIPDAHEWSRHRRVADLAPGTEVHMPLESGLFFKKVAVQAVKLDRYFVCSLRVGAVRSTITLRRQATGGSGYKLDFDASGASARVLLARIGEDGGETPDPVIELAGEDTVHVLRLWQRVLDSTEDLTRRRQTMTRATYEGMAVGELDEPRLVAERIVTVLAPIVREIAMRSGAPGELVLRRDVRAGRREEIYITTAELHEKVLTLPPLLRDVFAPFELEKPRSPRAPAPSLPAYTEIADDDVVEIAAAKAPFAQA
jgi:hypothetical protein